MNKKDPAFELYQNNYLLFNVITFMKILFYFFYMTGTWRKMWRNPEYPGTMRRGSDVQIRRDMPRLFHPNNEVLQRLNLLYVISTFQESVL